MKYVLTFLTVLLLNFVSYSQTELYKSEGGSPDDVDCLITGLRFVYSSDNGSLKEVTNAGGFGGASTLAIAGAAINVGFSFIQAARKERLKKFTSEDAANTINESPVLGRVPVIEVRRKMVQDGKINDREYVYSFDLVPSEVDEGTKLVYYTLQNFSLLSSEAKLTKAHSRLNMIVELSLLAIDDKGKNLIIKSSPIVIKNISTDGTYIVQNINSSIFKRKIAIVEAQVKITQANSTKVQLSEILSAVWGAGENLSTLLTTISENIDSDDTKD